MGIRFFLILAIAVSAYGVGANTSVDGSDRARCLYVLPLLNMPLEELNIPAATANALKKVRWKKIGDILFIPIEVVQARSGLSMDAMWGLIEALKEKKLFFNQPKRFVSIAVLKPLPSETVLALPLSELNLPLRALNVFTRSGIHDVAQLCRRTPDELMRLTNFGVGSLVEVMDVLEALNLDLAALPSNELKEKIRVYKTLVAERAKPLNALGLDARECLSLHMKGFFSVDELLRGDPRDVIGILGMDRFAAILSRAERDGYQPGYWKHRWPRVRARIQFEELKSQPVAYRLAQPVGVMPLRTAATNAVSLLKVRTLGDLALFTEKELEAENITQPTIRELRTTLALIDLKFARERIPRSEPFDVTKD